MLEQLGSQFTKYELARIVGARALQIAMDAPLLLKIDEKELEAINYNPIEIAKRELSAGILPITVHKPMPKKKEAKIRKLSKEELEEIRRKEKEKEMEKEKKAEAEVEKKQNVEAPIHSEEIKEDKGLEAEEESEEKKVTEDAEIMELSNPEDEEVEGSASASGEEEA